MGTTLVTGASGLVGSHVTRLLVQRGDDVRVTVRERSRMDNLKGLDVETFPCDVLDRRAVRRALRGVERVGGWFLRGDAGLRMIPGGIRDTGNTYEADLLVVRPGAPTQHIDATFRVEAGRITAINIAPR